MSPSALEIAANVLTTVAILLAARNSVHTWWTGIVGCVLFGVLFVQTRLYADAVLQVFFVATSVWGWWQWQQGARGRTLPVTHAPRRAVAVSVAVGVLVAPAYGALLHAFSDAAAPFADAAVLVCSVIAQWLLMQRRVQTWPLWLLTNSIAVPLFASRGLVLTAALYAGYWVNALVAWWHWRRLAAAAAGNAAPVTARS
jgi:nicotinamide mononucleotide transporter